MANQSTTARTSRSNFVTTIVISGAALVTVIGAAMFLRKLQEKRQQQEEHNDYKELLDKEEIDPQIIKLFQSSTEKSKDIMNHISNTEKLILYSLYKQSTMGDAPSKQPSGNALSFNIVTKTKYNAWNQLRRMSPQQAMLHYIKAIEQLEEKKGIIENNTSEGNINDMGLDDFDLGGTLGNNKTSTLMNNYDDDDDDDDENDGGNDNGKNLTIQQQFLRAASQNDIVVLERILSQQQQQQQRNGTNSSTSTTTTSNNNNIVDYRDKDGQTALHLAADKNSIEALKKLLQYGANSNAADNDGITVLHAAVIADNIEACKILLQYNANPYQSDIDGDTPYQCAQEDGSNEMKELFQKYS